MSAEPLYYAKRHQVWARSVETPQGDGTSNVTLGFKICECNQFVDGAADIIAKALNAVEGEPVAWRYELAAGMTDGEYSNWQPPQVTLHKPCVPEGAVRNLTPLYAGPL
jgi:hypothetical protein